MRIPLVFFLTFILSFGPILGNLVYAKNILPDMPEKEKRETAVLMAREGKYDQALAIFENDLNAKSPDASEAVVQDYMAILGWAGKNPQVVQLFEQRYAANPSALPPFLQRIVGDSYYRLQRYTEAKALYTLAADQGDQQSGVGLQKTRIMLKEIDVKDPSVDSKIVQEYAIELARNNKFDESIALFDSLIKEGKADNSCLYDYITVLNWAGKNDEALAVYQANFANAPEKLPPYTQRSIGNIYFSLGNFVEAKKMYSLAAAQGDAASTIALAESDVRLGDLHAAMRTFDKLVDGDPMNPEVYMQRGNAYLQAGAYYSADRDFEQALSLVPEDNFERRRQIQSTRAAAFISVSEFAAGRDILQPYIEKKQATMIMQCDYIISLQGTGAYDKAITEGERMWPDKKVVPPYGLRALGDCYLRMRKYSKAVECHDIVISHNSPEKRTSLLSKAYALAADNKVSAAKEVYAQAIREFPQTKNVIAGDAKGFFERGRFHAGKEVFRTLADSNPGYGPYRQQLAFDLFINEMPREAYVEYKKLAEETPSKEAGYAGMAQSAIMYGDYAAAEKALAKMSEYDTGSVDAVEAKRAWANRWRGSFEIGYQLFRNYQEKHYNLAGAALETDLGSSWRFLADAGYNNYKEDVDRSDVPYGSMGIGYVARKFDLRAWGAFFAGAESSGGYRVLGNYYFNDFMWLTYDELRANVENPTGIDEGIMHTTRDLTLNRRIGPKDLYTVGYLWDNYSDSNQNRGFHWRFGHMSIDWERKEVEWYIFQNHYDWDEDRSPLYDSPSSRVGYGPGLRMRWTKPRISYWEIITELAFGYDAPDSTDFTPYVRLERGWHLGPRKLLVAGYEYGLRTDRTNDDRSLNHGYHQFDIRYYVSW